MEKTANDPTKPTCLPLLSSQSQGWENILVEQFQHRSGEGRTHYRYEHTICLPLAPRPVRFLQIRGGKTHTSLFGTGDIAITPAAMPFFARWEGDDPDRLYEGGLPQRQLSQVLDYIHNHLEQDIKLADLAAA